ncbi:hypothetical protein BX616_005931 [Lobosporangium transversale]|nr:hypothetical protein BX616_005931 [Lobosporangium transversale]
MAFKRTVATRTSKTVTTTTTTTASTTVDANDTTEAAIDSPLKRLKTKHDSQEQEEGEPEKEAESSSDAVGVGKSVKATKNEEEPATTTATAAVKKPALVKKGSEPKTPLRPNTHINTTMPSSLVLPKAPEGCIKIVSWNVAGLNASLKKGFKTYIKAEDADVICLQEHKVNQPLMNLVDPKVYPFSWWGFEKDKKGYAGVVMFSKTTPISVTAGLPTHPDPDSTKGRIVTLEYPTCYLLGCYVPNAGAALVRLKERMVWDVAVKEWLQQLKAKNDGKHIIWSGDLNVCHKPIDLRNPSTNTMSAGFTKEEREGFSKILDEVGLVDTFREFQGEGEDAAGQYTYFSYRFQCRVKGIGWRLDYFVTDKEMFKERVVDSLIREECYGASDHLPIVLVVKGAL